MACGFGLDWILSTRSIPYSGVECVRGFIRVVCLACVSGLCIGAGCVGTVCRQSLVFSCQGRVELYQDYTIHCTPHIDTPSRESSLCTKQSRIAHQFPLLTLHHRTISDRARTPLFVHSWSALWSIKCSRQPTPVPLPAAPPRPPPLPAAAPRPPPAVRRPPPDVRRQTGTERHRAQTTREACGCESTSEGYRGGFLRGRRSYSGAEESQKR